MHSLLLARYSLLLARGTVWDRGRGKIPDFTSQKLGKIPDFVH